MFTTTGIHKSGNSWLANMVAELLASPGQTWSLSRYFCLGDVHLALRATGSPPPRGLTQAIAERLLHPNSQNRLDDPRATERVLIEHLSRRIRWNVARHNQPDYPTLDEIASELFARLATDRDEKPIPAETSESRTAPQLFLPSKHLPLPLLRRQFPDFRIVWIIRDPRDALVSYFYHDMGVLTSSKLPWLLQQAATGGWELRPDWRQSYLQRRVRQQLEFYQASHLERQLLETSAETAEHARSDRNGVQVLSVHYENLLDDCVGELKRISEFMQIDVPTSDLSTIADRFSFKTLTDAVGDTGDSFIRRGRANQWSDYFSRRDRTWLPDEYQQLLQSLGYDNSGDWLEPLPEQPVEPWDLGRFRLRSSGVYQAMDYWLDHPELQSRFPRPFDLDAPDSFFQHLRDEATAPQIRRWFEQVDLLWDPARELDRRHPADERLGY